MATKKDSNENSINRIKARKKEREKIARIRILGVVAILFVLVFLIAFCITSIINAFKRNKPLPKPEPVNLMSYNEILLEDTKKENFVYVEPIKQPVKHENGVSDRLESVKGAQSEEKLCYLTFDDGPHPEYTPLLLDGLKERNVSAAFFLMGKNAEKYPDIVERMAKEGHTVGNHSYSHVQLSAMKEIEACKEMTQANRVIEAITGKKPDYIRPPFGAWSHNLDCITNMIVVLWDVDPLDWKCQNTDLVVKRVVSNVKEDDIILLHDSYETTVEATFQIIDTLQKEGYEFVALDEMILE